MNDDRRGDIGIRKIPHETGETSGRVPEAISWLDRSWREFFDFWETHDEEETAPDDRHGNFLTHAVESYRVCLVWIYDDEFHPDHARDSIEEGI